ncbi:MAG: CBS domain-containing protein [Acidobacteriaceae bacterium]
MMDGYPYTVDIYFYEVTRVDREVLMQVRDIMSKTVFSCTPNDSVHQVARLMKDHDIGAVPIVADNTVRKLVGIVTDRDLCVKVIAGERPLRDTKVGDIMTQSPTTCLPTDSIEKCETLMREKQVRRIPVVDAKGVCVGMIAQADIALHDTSEHISKTLAAVSHPHTGTHTPGFSAA